MKSREVAKTTRCTSETLLESLEIIPEETLGKQISSRNHKNPGEIPQENSGATSGNPLEEIPGDRSIGLQGGILDDFQEEFRKNPKESRKGSLLKSIFQSFSRNIFRSSTLVLQ